MAYLESLAALVNSLVVQHPPMHLPNILLLPVAAVLVQGASLPVRRPTTFSGLSTSSRSFEKRYDRNKLWELSPQVEKIENARVYPQDMTFEEARTVRTAALKNIEDWFEEAKTIVRDPQTGSSFDPDLVPVVLWRDYRLWHDRFLEILNDGTVIWMFDPEPSIFISDAVKAVQAALLEDFGTNLFPQSMVVGWTPDRHPNLATFELIRSVRLYDMQRQLSQPKWEDCKKVSDVIKHWFAECDKPLNYGSDRAKRAIHHVSTMVFADLMASAMEIKTLDMSWR